MEALKCRCLAQGWQGWDEMQAAVAQPLSGVLCQPGECQKVLSGAASSAALQAEWDLGFGCFQGLWP
jgi:hypothetical protein